MASGNGASSVAQRAKAEPDAQEDFFSREVENPSLEQALERRQAAADKQRTAKGNYKTADDGAKALIQELDLQEDEVIRVGRFKIKLGTVKGGTPVSFETSPRNQLYISVIKD